MGVIAAAVIPAAAELLELGHHSPGAGEGGPLEELRSDTTRALEDLPDVAAVILLAGGDQPLVHDVRHATAHPQGGPARTGPVVTDVELVTAITRRGQSPRVQARAVEGQLGTLALLVSGLGRGAPVAAVTVPSRAAPQALDGVAVGILAAAAWFARPVAVVSSGELARPAATPVGVADGTAASASGVGPDEAGSVRSEAEELARSWDGAVVEAVDEGDTARMRSLGPEQALAADATGWAPLTVLLRIAEVAGLRVAWTSYHLAGHTGRLVASLEGGS